MNWTAADLQKATTPRQRPAGAPVPAAAVDSPGRASVAATAPVAPESRYCQGFGIVTRRDSPGQRFVAFGITPACAAELAAVALRHGLRASDTSHFILASQTH